jgi:hypothetical protein
MSRQYVQLWTWFNEFGRQARIANDQDRIRLYKIDDNAFEHRERNPEHALALRREGVALAERLHEPCMGLFYEYRVAEALLFHLARYEEGLDLATRIVTKASQEAYLNCPARARVFITLIAAYFEIDGLSYTDEIGAMIETMETRIPLDDDTHRRLFAYRAKLAMERHQYDKAVDEALLYVEISAESSFRSAHAYSLLTHLSYLMHQDRQALTYSHLMQDNALRANQYASLSHSYGWQALLLLMQGETEEAQRLFTMALAESNTLNLPKELNLLNGKCRFYDAKGEYDKSLALWNEQIQLMNPQTPKRQSYFYTFLRRCFVLRQMGRLTDFDIEQTRQAALRMRKPEKYLALIEELHDGQIAIPRY